MTQAEALAILESGESALLTGAAGTGKTYLLARFISRSKRVGRTVSVTATTGLAASHLSGSTIHAWSGMGVADHISRDRIDNLSKSRRKTIKDTDILIIDEISMLHDFRLDIVDQICRQVCDDDRPFGGIQVVLCGDFFQLPPVNRSDSREGGFVTGSDVWRSGHFHILYLQKQQRQRDDAELAGLLNAMRADTVTAAQRAILQERLGASLPSHIPATRLHTTNLDVDEINHRELSQLDTEAREYEMTTSGRKQYVEQLQKSCLAPQMLTLKIGALVMCVKNSQDRKYVNGSLGEVMAFEEGTEYPVVQLVNGSRITMTPDTWELMDGQARRAQLTQLPLRLAWAITVHKSQGMTLDAAEVNLSRTFAPGMGYVALSRVRSLDRLALAGLGARALEISPEARAIDAELRQASRNLHRSSTELFAAAAARWKEEAETGPLPEPGVTESGWAVKLAKMRETYPNAYRPWTDDDDSTLKAKYEEGGELTALSELFGRHPGSIRKRLEKHFGEDVELRD